MKSSGPEYEIIGKTNRVAKEGKIYFEAALRAPDANAEYNDYVYDEYELVNDEAHKDMAIPLLWSEYYDPDIYLYEDISSDEEYEYSDDSNAEDYYKNDYPDSYGGTSDSEGLGSSFGSDFEDAYY